MEECEKLSKRPAKSCKGGNTSSTLKLILRSASVFLSRNPDIFKSSEGSQSHTGRRCLARGASLGLATPPRKFRRDSDSESESEPGSPRVSCVGKVRNKGKRKRNKIKTVKRKMIADEDNSVKREWICGRKMRKTTMELQTASTENGAQGSGVGIETAPCLNQMKRFASGRGSSLSDFEWD